MRTLFILALTLTGLAGATTCNGMYAVLKGTRRSQVQTTGSP